MRTRAVAVLLTACAVLGMGPGAWAQSGETPPRAAATPPAASPPTPAMSAPQTTATQAQQAPPPPRVIKPRAAVPLLLREQAPASLSGTRSLSGRMPLLAPSAGAYRGYEPAPTPNPDIFAPTVRGPTEPRLGATLTPRAQGFGTKGDGFSPGSSYSGYFDRRGRATEGIGSTLAPSFTLRVPLD